MTKEMAVYDILENLSIPFEIIEAKSTSHKPLDNKQDCYCNSVLLNSNLHNKTYMIISKSDKQIDHSKLACVVKEDTLTTSQDHHLYYELNLTPDCVSPFGLIYDLDTKIHLVIDQDLVGEERMVIHPNVSHARIVLSHKHFESYLSWIQNEVQYVRI